jgi:hypothetical protein
MDVLKEMHFDNFTYNESYQKKVMQLDEEN